MHGRTRSSSFFLVLVVVALCASAIPRPAAAAWPEFGRAICNATGSQQHSVITTDGAGGAIVAWQDFRTAPAVIAAQHVLASGELDVAWPHFGRTVMGDPPTPGGLQTFPIITSDGAGGAIIVWEDLRSVVTEIDLYAQHILANGTLDPAWLNTGTALTTATGQQEVASVISDGAGGAIVVWRDNRAGQVAFDVYAQHILATGVVDPLWPSNGFPVCTAAGEQQSPVIVEDGSGGAVIAWSDGRVTPDLNIFAQRIQITGAIAPGWPVNGQALCTAADGQGAPTIVSDGAHGAVVAWGDSRDPAGQHIFAQHVFGSGVVDPAWPLDGRIISGVATIESRPRAVSDGAGGAVVNWQGFTNHTDVLNMYVQHVQANGTVDPAWPAGGQTLSFRQKQQSFAEIASDGAGGAIVAWTENAQHNFAQHVLASGTLDPAFPADGRALCNLPTAQGDVAIVSAGVGGAIVSWSDNRDGALDIYAIQVLDAHPTGVPVPTPQAITFAPAFPNPAQGSTTLRFVLPSEAQVRVAIYDVAGRRVRELASGQRPAGEQTLAWDMRDQNGREVSAGVYFARLDADRSSLTQKLVKLK
jgi:hypothetical protein